MFLAPFGSSIIFVFPTLLILLLNSLPLTLHFDPSPPQTPHLSSSTGESLIYSISWFIKIIWLISLQNAILIHFANLQYYLPYRNPILYTFLEHKHPMDYHTSKVFHQLRSLLFDNIPLYL